MRSTLDCDAGPFIHFKFKSQKTASRFSTHGSTQLLGREVRNKIGTIMGVNGQNPNLVGHIHLFYPESFRRDEHIKDTDLVRANSRVVAARMPLPWNSKFQYATLIGATPPNMHCSRKPVLTPVPCQKLAPVATVVATVVARVVEDVPFVPTIAFPSIYRPSSINALRYA